MFDESFLKLAIERVSEQSPVSVAEIIEIMNSKEYSNIFGACLFLFTVATGFRIQARSERKKPLHITHLKVKIDQYDHILVEIQQPINGPNKITQTLKNDDILSKIVPMVGKGLYVYICANVDLPKSIVCEYISDTYSRLWDEMLKNKCLSINCVVMGDIYGSDFSRSQMRTLPQLNAVFTYDPDIKEALDTSRSKAGLQEVSFTYTNHIIKDQPKKNKTGQAAVYYFDADSIHIPKFRKVYSESI
jgi:hypothetical protein